VPDKKGRERGAGRIPTPNAASVYSNLAIEKSKNDKSNTCGSTKNIGLWELVSMLPWGFTELAGKEAKKGGRGRDPRGGDGWTVERLIRWERLRKLMGTPQKKKDWSSRKKGGKREALREPFTL